MTTEDLTALLRDKGGSAAAEVLNRREEIAAALEQRPALSPEDARRLAKLRGVCGNRRLRDPKDERQDEFLLRIIRELGA